MNELIAIAAWMRRTTSARASRSLTPLVAALIAAACVAPMEPVDERFDVEGVQGWYLVADELTPGDDVLRATVVAHQPVDSIVASVGAITAPLERHGDVFQLEVSIAELGPGEHELTLRADGGEPFARIPFQRSHALYVMVSTDWDDADPTDSAIGFQDGLHDRHPAARITHFVGPYTFTDPVVPDARRDELAAWLIEQRDEHGDEIGLHIHPYCHFVEHAGVSCVVDQSTVYEDGDATGYTINLSAYDEASFGQLLDAADALFLANDLGKPVTFRAGGWTASIETLRALESRGYVADTSANNWARMEEWRGSYSGELYRWNMEHWATIGDTSQPYYPNRDDILSDAAPALSILEVPDNAIMVDYVSVEEMSDILSAVWPGDALSTPVTYMMGFHPSSFFTETERQRVDGLLDLTDQHLAANGEGPVVYALLRDMPVVFAP